MEQIKEKVIKVLQKFSYVEETISCEDSLTAIGIDSLTLVEVVITLEDELGIRFDDSSLSPQNFDYVQNLIDLAEKYIGK